MSLSKKANKKGSTKRAQKITGTSAPSSRVAKKNKEQPLEARATQAANYPQPKSSKFLNNALRVLALLGVIAITIYIYSIRERVGQFERFGYPGIFLISLLANATVLLPAPGVAIIYAMGAIFNPFGVGLAAGTGGAIGELSGYLAGFSGQAVIEQTDIYNRIRPWVEKYGGWAIMVLSAIPNPFFDVAGIAAGMAKMPLRTFLAFVWIGQLIKMMAFALAGHYSIAWLNNLIK
ncbi:MAG TPA: VTT domain-containing protein [Anaerolineales bacterium]|nr:VTT domain-containing protein [Anaerolineales bacterium]HLO33905.1 VTT domain-containing protein [Anaerolineales bacterium]